MRENARILQRILGRMPTKEEIIADMVAALTKDMDMKDRDQLGSEGEYRYAGAPEKGH